MTPRRLLLVGVAVAGLAAAGAGVASAVMDLPQDAVPVQDPVGDALRNRTAPPAVDTPATQTSASQVLVPQVLTPPAAPIVLTNPDLAIAAVQEEVPEDVDAVEVEAVVAEDVPVGPRQRRRVAIVHAINKVTAESMRFEVPVGGRPIRFNKTLVFNARACEITSSDEAQEDHIAYMEVGVQPRGALNPLEIRQIFRGWMFASSPGINGMQHPVYDAWVIGCKA